MRYLLAALLGLAAALVAGALCLIVMALSGPDAAAEGGAFARAGDGLVKLSIAMYCAAICALVTVPAALLIAYVRRTRAARPV